MKFLFSLLNTLQEIFTFNNVNYFIIYQFP